jgi:predicted dehydrogenase
VVGIVESDRTLRQKAEQSDSYHGLPWMTEEELLSTPGLQAVAVETRMKRSLDVAERCIAAGKHLHLDKPPGSDLLQFRRLLEAADRQQLTVQLGYMYRYNPGIVLLRELLHQGWLGEVFEVNAVMSKEVGRSKRQQWAHYPGGSMFELGCHLIDLLIGILGRPDQVTPYNRHSGDFDDGLIDNMLAVCEYRNATATIRSTAVEVEGFDRRHLAVCGTKGTFHLQPLDEPVVQLALSEPRGDYKRGYQTIQFDKYQRYVDDLADLAAIIRGEKQSDFDSDHDLAAQETLLKACKLPLGK